jgi:uncharacterized caspase-like protein
LDIKPGDYVYVYFSGHSLTVHEQSYILPFDFNTEAVDNTTISVKSLIDHAVKSGADHAVLFFDTTLAQAFPEYTAISEPSPSHTELSKHIAIFVGNSPGQATIEDYSLGHGLFTYYLLQGLSGSADITADGLIEVQELQNYLQAQVSSASRGQTRPSVYVSGGNFVLAVPEYSRR